MLETVKTLCSLSGVSSAEGEVRDYILTRVMPHADSISTDSAGNLIVFKKGAVTPPQKLLVCAHMDEVGLIVTGFRDDGSLRFGCVGGIDRRVLIGKRVFVGPERRLGVIGNKAIHLTSADERKKTPKVDDMYIDVGCRDEEDVKKVVSLGDICVFDDSIVEFGDGFLKAKAIDDRVGCAAMIKLIESDLPCDVMFAFTVQEEVGTRGAGVMSYAVAPDCALILEGTTGTDLPDIDEGKVICHAGDGVVIPFMDGGTMYDRGMYALLGRLADENGIKHQTKRRIAGGTDASAVQRSRAGVRVGAISCALRNIHSQSCIGKISEFDDMLSLASAFLKHFAEKGLE